MINKMTQSGALPEVSGSRYYPFARKSSCASTEVPISACIVVAIGACIEGHEEPRAIEAVVVPVDDNQQYMSMF
jgi:hypothetical protein